VNNRFFITDSKIKWIFLIPSVLLLLFILIYPLIFSLRLSFSEWKAGSDMVFVGFENYKDLFTDKLFYTALKNTFIFVILATLFELIFGFILALILNREIGKIRNIFRICLILPMMLTPVVVGVTWRMLFNPQYGLVNFFLNITGFQWISNPKIAIFSLIITDIWEWTPFMFIIILAGLQSIPDYLYESASIDGAGTIHVHKYITLPLIMPTILLAVIIRSMDAIKVYDIVYTLTYGGPGSSTEVISWYIYRQGFTYWKMGYAAAASYIMLILIAVLVMLFLKYTNKFLKIS